MLLNQETHFPLTNADEMEVFLQEVSRKYQNVMQVREESRDNVQVEYRLTHSD